MVKKRGKKAPSKAEPDPIAYENQVRCRFGNVSVGKQTVSMGVNIPRGDLALVKADKLLVNCQLDVEIGVDPNNTDDPAQGTFPTIDSTVVIVAQVNVGGMGVKPAGYHVTLSLPKTACSLDDLGQFTGCWGKMSFNRIGPAQAESVEAE